MDSGAILLIDTSKEYLKSASPYFGRIFIACILQEVYARANKHRHPTYLIIDEAAEYLDSNIDEFLTQARKYKCGVVLAHQSLSQATTDLRASLSANTAIKMVAGVSTADARTMAPDLRTTADYILNLPRLTFATYIRNVTQCAIPFTVTPGLLDEEEHVEHFENPEELEIPTDDIHQEAPPEHIDERAEDAPTNSIDLGNTDATEKW